MTDRFLARLIAMSAAALAPGLAATADPALETAILDGGVIQRDMPVSLQGRAAPGSAVTIAFAGPAQTVEAGPDGRWAAELAPVQAGGPYTLRIADSEGVLTVSDVLVGDVFLCSGQSNMEFPVRRALNPDAETPPAPDAALRLLDVPKVAAVAPAETLPEGTRWQVASAESVPDFSAVCYFMGRALRGERRVPVGLIDSSWGGSQIEAWLPQEALDATDLYDRALHQIELYRQDRQAAMADFGDAWESWWADEHGSQPWMEEEEGGDWSPVPADFPDWHTYEDEATRNHLGRLWYRKRFTLTEEEAETGDSVSLGLFDDSDATWLNGEFLGSTASWSDQRTYDIPEGVLKPGENTLLINVLNTYGPGGMTGPADVLALNRAGGDPVPLADGWQYRVVTQDDGGGPRPPWEAVSGYTTIHNAMVAPLAGLRFAGAIWYQGESNTGRPGEYGVLLDALIGAWRDMFGEALPVIVVELPGYGVMPEDASALGWGALREAQRQVALADEQTGLAVIIDAGDRTDIHPPNKQLAAKRVLDVMAAMKDAAARPAATGYSPLRLERDGAEIDVVLPEGDYTLIGSDQVTGLAVCDAEGTCAWASGTLEGNRISLAAPEGAEAGEVRYCAGDAPVCNLFVADETPVTPFVMAWPDAG